MSGKTSFIIIALLIVVVTVFVYQFSIPAHHGHISVLGVKDPTTVPAASDSLRSPADSSRR